MPESGGYPQRAASRKACRILWSLGLRRPLWIDDVTAGRILWYAGKIRLLPFLTFRFRFDLATICE